MVPEPSGRYSEILLDHFMHPRNSGDLEDPDGEATITNPVCGDITRMQIRVDRGTLLRVGWKTQGCSTSIAASSMISELLTGVPLAEAQRLTPEDVEEALEGLPPAKRHAAILVVEAAKAAIADFRSGQA